MSCTVLIDEQERERRFENRLNAVARHCQVKVKQWKGKVGNGFGPIVAAPALPNRNGFLGDPYIPQATWLSPPVMDHPRNCHPFISAFTAQPA